ncbi:MAG: polysaccharide biosynthesis/export family protein [Flavobacteriales bacterium]|nr:polysaccharide biosynthesis/export family protein [Flavobacteriales bacterium]
MLKRLFFPFIVLALSVSSCSLNKEFLFKTDEDFVFDVPVIDSSSIDYKIQPHDELSFDLYTNDGAMMLEFTTSSAESPKYGISTSFTYKVNSAGNVEFPVIGERFIAGLTVQQAQDFLEEQYTYQFNKPYAVMKVLNRRAIVFNAPAGNGTVIPLDNEGMSIIEAIAIAGGGGKNGDVSNIKVIRKVAQKQEVYHIDLSTIDGIKYANMSVEAGDIIYVTPTRQLGREIIADVQPYVTIMSGLSIVYGVFSRVF